MNLHEVVGKIALATDCSVYTLKGLKNKSLKTVESVNSFSDYEGSENGFCVVQVGDTDPVFVKIPFFITSSGVEQISYSQAKIVKGKEKTITIWE